MTRSQSSTAMRKGLARSTGSRGQIILEFAFSFPFVLLMLVGTFAIGMMLDRQLTVTQLARNAGNMYARGFDFEPNSNKEVLLRAATGLGITLNGGKGVVYLSTIRVAPIGSGANEGQPVLIERFVIGAPATLASSVGMPPALADGTVPDYYNEPTALATIPSTLAAGLLPGDRLFVAEVFHEASELTFPGIVSPDLMRARFFF